ncbi:MAG: hypothetical protein U0946_04700 [Patescibacteria group bacterium]|nr:hypothetical protein [Patescibacteria group bacterium]
MATETDVGTAEPAKASSDDKRREVYASVLALTIIAMPFTLIANPDIAGNTFRQHFLAVIIAGLLYHCPGSKFEEWETLIMNKIIGNKPA